jgi:hypothetical protein
MTGNRFFNQLRLDYKLVQYHKGRFSIVDYISTICHQLVFQVHHLYLQKYLMAQFPPACAGMASPLDIFLLKLLFLPDLVVLGIAINTTSTLAGC